MISKEHAAEHGKALLFGQDMCHRVKNFYLTLYVEYLNRKVLSFRKMGAGEPSHSVVYNVTIQRWYDLYYIPRKYEGKNRKR